LLDSVLGVGQGAIFYRGASTWTALVAGISGQFLRTAGPGANPTWGSPVGATPIADKALLDNLSGATATATGRTLSDILDAIITSVRGGLLFRGAAGWTNLAPGSAGQVLTTGGAGVDPTWSPASGSGATNLDQLTDVTTPTPSADDILAYGPTAWQNKRQKYQITAHAPGVPTASRPLLLHKFSKATTIPANFGSYLGHLSEAGCALTATATTIITIAKAPVNTPNTFTDVGQITFAPGAGSGTFASTGGLTVNFAQGDVLRLSAPSTPDTTFGEFYATIIGQET
jgi:hypothetical protein